MVRLNRIYTRTGDDGSTGLVDGSRVSKADPRVEAYGTVDELLSNLGDIRATLSLTQRLSTPKREALDNILSAIQQDLFDMGSLLASPPNADLQLPTIEDGHITALEKLLDAYNAKLEPLKSFVLPGGHALAAKFHGARCVCRRAERRCVGLDGVDQTGRRLVPYLNRLSDFLFVLARWTNHALGQSEPLWKPGGGLLAQQGEPEA